MGSPASRSRPTVASQRCRGPNGVADDSQARPRSRSRSCTGEPGTLWWISAFGRRSANVAGWSRSDSRAERVSVRGRAVHDVRPGGDPAQLVAGALDQRPRRSLSCVRQAAATSPSSYCRSTLNARTTCGRRPASSKPPRRNSSSGGSAAGCAAATRTGSISRPTTATSARTAADSRARSSTAVTGVDAVTQINHQRYGAPPPAARRTGTRSSCRRGAAGWGSWCPG